MGTKSPDVLQFLRVIETSFKVRVLTEEEIVLGILKGATYSKHARDDEKWNDHSLCWVYDSNTEGHALAFDISEFRLKEIFKSLEQQGLIMKDVDSDGQGGLYPKHAFIPKNLRSIA